MLALTQGLMTTGGIAVNTKALLSFDGTNASTTFTDQVPKTWTANGAAQLSTAEKRFGTASLLLDAVSDFITTPWVSGFSILGNFTIECFVRRTATGRDAIFTNYSGPTNGALLDIGSSNELRLILGTGSYIICSSGATTVPINAWTHVAGVRDGSTLRVFVDGVQAGTLTITGVVADASSLVYIGRDPLDTTRDFGGNLDEFRFSNVARYTGNFTPPAAPFSLD